MQMRRLAIALLFVSLVFCSGQALALTLDNGLTGVNNFNLELGQGNTSNTIGFGGWNDQVYSWDVLIDIDGFVSSLADNNFWTEYQGGALGNNAMSYVNNASGLKVQVDGTLGIGSNVLATTYTLFNGGSSTISNISLFQYLDPDLGGTAINDAAVTSVGDQTMLLAMNYDSVPNSSIGLVNGGTMAGQNFVGWEIGHYNELEGRIFAGNYDLSNTINGTNPFDVAMALQYHFDILAAGASFQASTELVANPTPEPATLLLLGSGMLGMAYLKKRKKA